MSIGRLSEVGALWDYVPRVCGVGSGCAGGGVPLGDVLVLSWYGEVSLGGKQSISACAHETIPTKWSELNLYDACVLRERLVLSYHTAPPPPPRLKVWAEVSLYT